MIRNFEKILDNEARVRGLANLSVKRLQALLKSQNYALILPTMKISPGWPAEIVRVSRNAQTCAWYMSNGKQWREFYCYCLTTYMTEHKLIPAFIYERKIINGKYAYAPVVDLMISLNGRIKQASTGFCRNMRRETFGPRRERPISERFDKDANAVWAFARVQAQRLRHNRIGTEHLLMGLLSQSSSKAFRALDVVFGAKAMRRRLAKLIVPGPRDTVVPDTMPFTNCGKRAFVGTFSEARWLGKKLVSIEHVLLSLCRVTDGTSAQVLEISNLDATALRKRLGRELGLRVQPVEEHFKWARGKRTEAFKFCQTIFGQRMKPHGRVNWSAFNEDTVKYRGEGAYEVHASCEYSKSKSRKVRAIVHSVVNANRKHGWGIESLQISSPVKPT